MKTTTVTVTNKMGLHARPSAKVSQLATEFSCEVWLTRNDRRINAKSIMGVMMLAASCGSDLKLEVDGVDEDAALEKITTLFAEGFGELAS